MASGEVEQGRDIPLHEQEEQGSIVGYLGEGSIETKNKIKSQIKHTRVLV